MITYHENRLGQFFEAFIFYGVFLNITFCDAQEATEITVRLT